jgi:UDP-galactopyranose mutase
VVFDNMDELSAFHGASPHLAALEAELLDLADIVFTGGASLYEAKKGRHDNVFCFPSSVDTAHFQRARQTQDEPKDQAELPTPRIGFFGVVDERLDVALLADVAAARPDWTFVMIGPVVKIDPESLPRTANIQWLGLKSYVDLPAYLAGWDVAIMPFARNEATRYISPTKTPEYLAAGVPVVSTSIQDVVRPYGDLGLVDIADHPQDFIDALERALSPAPASWLEKVDAKLATMSWNRTWGQMNTAIQRSIAAKTSQQSKIRSEALV